MAGRYVIKLAMISIDLYGFQHADLEKARAIVEHALGIRLELHDSLYYGEYYLGKLPDEHSVRLQLNIDPIHNPQTGPPEELFAEPKFRDSPLLLYVSGSSVDVIRERLDGAVGISFLRRKS